MGGLKKNGPATRKQFILKSESSQKKKEERKHRQTRGGPLRRGKWFTSKIETKRISSHKIGQREKDIRTRRDLLKVQEK